jgi:radical SAM protein with 4Fe4S-binding SPASM domain
MSQIFVLNPEYILRNDINRIILASKEDGITTFIHPLQAMIISFFDKPLEYSVHIKRISDTLQIESCAVEDFIARLLHNSEKLWIGEGHNSSHYPENVIITLPENYSERGYHYKEFLTDGKKVDLISKRFQIPIETMLMINTLCYTDCIYCYADRRNKINLKIPIERLSEIIKEARELKFRKFDTSGGEFFLYEKWELLLTLLISNGFYPTIPTKIPLSRCQISKIKEFGVKEIQISLDSINSTVLSKTLNVSNEYWKKINTTIHELEKAKVHFRINTIVTKYNSGFNEIEKLVDYLLHFEFFNQITIGCVGFTLYKSPKHNRSIMPNKLNIESVFKQLMEKYANNSRIIISEITLFKDNFHLSHETFFKKALCTGNFQGFIILPDGKVTICEELYWHPKFIIGDLTKQSIMEVWNSEKANELIYLNKNSISKCSACRSCNWFEACHQSGGKCWREIIKSYGEENWDYPDPRCPLSPEPINNIYIG